MFGTLAALAAVFAFTVFGMDGIEFIFAVFAAVVTVCSALANLVSPTSWLGKLLHFLALNGPAIQRAIRELLRKPEPPAPEAKSLPKPLENIRR